jgi:hypothetical protein
MMPASNPSPVPDASPTRSGVVNRVAQSFDGAKTFLARIVATLGVTAGLARLDMRSDLGAGASDVCTVVGSTVADASVNGTAALLEGRTGLGGTEVSKFRFRKSGALLIGIDTVTPIGVGFAADLANVADGLKYNVGTGVLGLFNSNNGAFLGLNLGTGSAQASGSMGVGGILGVGNVAPGSAGLQLVNAASAQVLGLNKPLFLYATGTSAITETVRLVGQRGDAGLKCVVVGTEQSAPNADCELLRVAHSITSNANDAGNGTALARVTASGRLDQRGVVSGVVGADTQNNPKGVNTLASGATSVTITNSLVTASSWVDVTFHADPGGRYWVTRAAGSFTVSVSAAPGANAPFSWEVSTLL